MNDGREDGCSSRLGFTNQDKQRDGSESLTDAAADCEDLIRAGSFEVMIRLL